MSHEALKCALVGDQLFGVSVSNTPRSTRLKRCVLYALYCNTILLSGCLSPEVIST